ncbi:MAG TPA: hypothetical protein VLU46_10415 [Thermoanaerobaculia bacterium]|nr:hypothetical protein [Thermoanaerobaculia bacterium]
MVAGWTVACDSLATRARGVLRRRADHRAAGADVRNFGSSFALGDFDVSPDGREILFDRQQDNSDIVLAER